MSFIDIAVAAEPQAQEGGLGVMMLFYIGLFAILYFLLIRPQSKKAKEVRLLQSSLTKDDKVVTNGGLVGVVHKVDEEFVTLEIAKDVRVKVQKGAIFGKVSDTSQAKQAS